MRHSSRSGSGFPRFLGTGDAEFVYARARAVADDPSMDPLANGLKRAHGLGRRFGPYLLVEALLPGGTLLALALYLFRNRRIADSDPDEPVTVDLPGG